MRDTDISDSDLKEKSNSNPSHTQACDYMRRCTHTLSETTHNSYLS